MIVGLLVLYALCFIILYFLQSVKMFFSYYYYYYFYYFYFCYYCEFKLYLTRLLPQGNISVETEKTFDFHYKISIICIVE